VTRDAPGFREPGMWMPTAGWFTREMWLDQGVVYLFDTGTGRCLRALREGGHRGTVLAASFAPERAGRGPVLVTAAREWDERAHAFRGGLRVWDAERGAVLARRTDLPDPFPASDSWEPGLAAAWRGGAREPGLVVALAWK